MSGDRFTEASITINGIPLSAAQSMTVRVALENFASGLETPVQRHGMVIENFTDQLYRNRIQEIREMIFLAPEFHPTLSKLLDRSGYRSLNSSILDIPKEKRGEILERCAVILRGVRLMTEMDKEGKNANDDK